MPAQMVREQRCEHSFAYASIGARDNDDATHEGNRIRNELRRQLAFQVECKNASARKPQRRRSSLKQS
jgi:hypothetical protein